MQQPSYNEFVDAANYYTQYAGFNEDEHRFDDVYYEIYRQDLVTISSTKCETWGQDLSCVIEQAYDIVLDFYDRIEQENFPTEHLHEQWVGKRATVDYMPYDDFYVVAYTLPDLFRLVIHIFVNDNRLEKGTY